MKKVIWLFIVFISSFSAAEEAKEPPMKFVSSKYIENMEIQKSVKIVQFPKLSFPAKAIKEKQQGWCAVKLNLSESGTPQDIDVVECSPAGYFENACKTGAQQLKYKGEVLPVKGIIFKCNFSITNN